MGEIRELRRSVGLSQQDCAELLNVPVETFRTWDSGRRPIPVAEIQRARKTLPDHAQQAELLPLRQLAAELGVHVRTLQVAARTGRLEARFSEKSVFGRPRRMASRAAGEKFKRTHYRRFAGQAACPAPLPAVNRATATSFATARSSRRSLSAPQRGLTNNVRRRRTIWIGMR